MPEGQAFGLVACGDGLLKAKVGVDVLPVHGSEAARHDRLAALGSLEVMEAPFMTPEVHLADDTRGGVHVVPKVRKDTVGFVPVRLKSIIGAVTSSTLRTVAFNAISNVPDFGFKRITAGIGMLGTLMEGRSDGRSPSPRSSFEVVSPPLRVLNGVT